MHTPPGPSQKSIKVGSEDIFYPINGVEVSEDEISIAASEISMSLKATTFSWELELGEELANALRQHVHDRIKHLPSNYLLAVEPTFDEADARRVVGVKVAVVVPHSKGFATGPVYRGDR